MKNNFLGFYQPTKAEINNAWLHGTFIFDSNALLNLYRYSDSTRKDYLLVLNRLKAKLFMPYQVGFEFHNNRSIVINASLTRYDTFTEEVEKLFNNSLVNIVNNYKRHPSIDIIQINKLMDVFLKNFKKELHNQKQTHPDFITQDEVLNQITNLFKNKVGKQFTIDELERIYLEAKKRYEQKIPPGYEDQKEKKNEAPQRLYGDVIIWKEIINYGKKFKRPVILITDDRKEDWWKIHDGKILGPREELIQEYFNETKSRILIYNTESFLKFAMARKLVPIINPSSLNEIKDVREHDEILNLMMEELEQLKNEVKVAAGYLPSKLPDYTDALNSSEKTLIKNLNLTPLPSEEFSSIKSPYDHLGSQLKLVPTTKGKKKNSK